jgi:hypothetical protein
VKCKQCKRELDLSVFIKDDKQLTRCKTCRDYANEYYDTDSAKAKSKIYRKARRAKNIEYFRQSDKLYKRELRKTPENKEYRKQYNIKNKEKIKAFDRNRMDNRPEYFLWSSARKRARNKLEFSITEADVKELLNTTICPLRNTQFERGIKGPADNSKSLDRIDNTKGYIKDNIQIISYRANIIKNNTDLNLFRTIVNGLKNYTPVIHPIDDLTRQFLIEDRIRWLKENDRTESWLLNVEERMFNSAQRRVKTNKLSLTITYDDIKAIYPLDNKCPILKTTFIIGNKTNALHSATLDRIDNTKGYEIGNIQVISSQVNVVKNKATIAELEVILKNWEKLEREKCL